MKSETEKPCFAYNKRYTGSDFIPNTHPIDTLKLYTKSFTLHPNNKLIKALHESYYIPESHTYKIKLIGDTFYFSSEVHKLLNQNPLYQYQDLDLPHLFEAIQNIFYDVGVEVNGLQVSRLDCFQDKAVDCISYEIEAFSNGLLDNKGNSKTNYKGYIASSNSQNCFCVYDKRTELILKEKKKLMKIDKLLNDPSTPISDIFLLYQLHVASKYKIKKYKSMGKLLRIEYRLLTAKKIKQMFGNNDLFHVMKNLNILIDLRNKTAIRMYKPTIKKKYEQVMDESTSTSKTIKNKLSTYFIESLKIRFNNDSNKIRIYLKEYFSDWQFKQLWKMIKK